MSTNAEEVNNVMDNKGDNGPAKDAREDEAVDQSSSSDEEGSLGTPHSQVVRKQRYASKLLKRRIHNNDEPAPQVFLPEETSWRIHNLALGDYDQKSEWSNYRERFCDKVHLNYRGSDPELGPVIISVLQDSEKKVTELIVRTSSGTFSETFPDSSESEDTLCDGSVLNLTKILVPELKLDSIDLIYSDNIEDLITTYDNNYHQLLKRNKYAFGVLIQKSGQVTEQDIFGNIDHGNKFGEFLPLLGEYQHHQNDDSLGFYVKEHDDISLKFYVLTCLPHSKSDNQQCLRKARIGNCVVSIVFQEEEATFSPEIITSQFLHVYIVIQPIESDRFKVSVVSKIGVPEFGPKMESTEVLNKENIGKFLSKLVNAEQASYKTGKLAILRKKYRLAGLDHIIKKLEEAEADVVVDNGKWRVCNVL